MDKHETRIKRNHIILMKHQQSALYGGVMLMGDSEVIDGNGTAYTDGINKRYYRRYLDTVKTEPVMRGLIMHENLHVALKHIPRGKNMFKENPRLANMAADFVVNDIIMHMDGKLANGEKLVELPDGALYDPMFHDWSMPEVYEFLKKNCKPQKPNGGGNGGKGKSGDEGSGPPDGGEQHGDGPVSVNGKQYDNDSLDEHDFESVKDLTPEEVQEIEGKIEKAIREGGILAGRLGAKIPRVISDLLAPKIDWRDVLRDFVSQSTKGKDEFTWRKMNKRQMANDIYLPSVEDETIGEVIVAIDTSGSIGSRELSAFASELASICGTVNPEKVRVLWWDTQVHGEQVFQGDYTNIAGLLKPVGGGGTCVSSVSRYLSKKTINAECVIVLTDGYVEDDIKWTISTPTLWVVTENKSFHAPVGKQVRMEK